MPRTIFQEIDGSWLFITPIANVILTDAVDNEFTVGRVLFIHKDKLPRIRRRLGLRKSLAETKASFHSRAFRDFFDLSNTFAVVTQRGKPGHVESTAYRLVSDALSLLSLSQLGYSRRRSSAQLAIFGEHGPDRSSRVLIQRDGQARGFGGKITRGLMPLSLDGQWRRYQKETFFFKLLRILYGASSVDSHWRHDLTVASTFMGQSFNTRNLVSAFLWNMIALERLLARRGDAISSVLPARTEAFLGWVGYWEFGSYSQRMREIYEKRSELVHAGAREVVTRRDVLFTDEILLNLMSNLVNLSHLFPSKQHVVEFAQKVEAERILGVKPRVRPKKLQYVSHTSKEEDFGEI